MTPPYDPQNIFAKILREEIPCKKVHEDDFSLAFHDISPQAPLHILIIPKGPYTGFPHFMKRASPAEITGFFQAVEKVGKELGVEAGGYRLITNNGPDGGQEVPHFHVHLLAGKKLGPKIVA